MITVEFRVYSGEAYDTALDTARASPGWLEMWIDDLEAYADEDPLAYMTVHFDTDQHAMLYRLKLGV
jgi:hypothetical protein